MDETDRNPDAERSSDSFDSHSRYALARKFCDGLQVHFVSSRGRFLDEEGSSVVELPPPNDNLF